MSTTKTTTNNIRFYDTSSRYNPTDITKTLRELANAIEEHGVPHHISVQHKPSSVHLIFEAKWQDVDGERRRG